MTDTDAGLREFVEREWAPLVRLAYLLTGDRGHAEDLVQAALEKTHRRWDKVARMDAPIAYVRRVMVNTAISWRRRRRVVEVPLLAAARSSSCTRRTRPATGWRWPWCRCASASSPTRS